jgi:UDP-N-acetylglucosamine--N-acetylmuramyl-(pentapeptide) pyrophosphoryl-undecaprenol N-acetylglucosamine transferase
MNNIIFCAGGTGGHVFPAIAMAEEFVKRGYSVHFITDTRAAKFLQDTKFEYDIVNSATFGAGIVGKIKCILPLCLGFFESIGIILKQKPELVIGFGGYPTVPPLLATFCVGKKTFTHESNAVLGLANIMVAPFVNYIFTTHEATKGIKSWFEHKIRVTGNPIRDKIRSLSDLEFPPFDSEIKIMIVGGSLGAKIFSGAVVEAVCSLPDMIKSKLNIIQQSRAEDIDRVIAQYKTANIKVTVREFYADLPEQLRDTHLLIARAGAGTVTELTMAGRPAIYIPYPHNRDRQQYFNAQQIVARQGGWMMDEADVTVSNLQSLLINILQNPLILKEFGGRAKALSKPNANADIANLMIESLNISS